MVNDKNYRLSGLYFLLNIVSRLDRKRYPALRAFLMVYRSTHFGKYWCAFFQIFGKQKSSFSYLCQLINLLLTLLSSLKKYN